MCNEVKIDKIEENAFKTFIKKNKNKIFITTAGVGIAGLSFLGIKFVPKIWIERFNDVIENVNTGNGITKVTEIAEQVVEDVKNSSARYLVEVKPFQNDNWYIKTSTDYINSAYSVGACNTFGRAYRIIDTVTGDILKEVAEDSSMAACKGYPNGYPW